MSAAIPTRFLTSEELTKEIEKLPYSVNDKNERVYECDYYDVLGYMMTNIEQLKLEMNGNDGVFGYYTVYNKVDCSWWKFKCRLWPWQGREYGE
jgi:hypothetical protein